MMERLYSKEDIIFDGFNSKRENPYRIFRTITTDKKMDKYSTQFYALNDYAYFITESVNNRIKGIDNRMKELLEWMQDDNFETVKFDDGTYSDANDLVELYFGEEEEKNYWMPLTEQISTNTIIMCLLSFFEGVLKEITNTFIEKLEVDIKTKPQNTKECIKVLKIYDRNNLLKSVEKEKKIIIQAKKIRNRFVHEQWMTIKNNVWDFKTRKVLQQLSISDLINAITNMLETIEMIGIKNNVYKMKN